MWVSKLETSVRKLKYNKNSSSLINKIPKVLYKSRKGYDVFNFKELLSCYRKIFTDG